MPAAPDRHARQDDPQAGLDDVVLDPMDDDDAGAAGEEWRAARSGDTMTTATLRSRLALVAGFLALFNLAFAMIRLAGPAVATGFTSDTPAWSLLARAAFAALVFVLVRSPLRLGRGQVRLVEAALLCVEMFFILSMQYLSTVELIDRRDLIDAVAVQKNGVIRTLVLMICCGVFLPWSPAATARVTVTMAAGLIFCHGMVLHHADTVGLAVNHVAGQQIVMANALFLVMGVLLSALAAWVTLEGNGSRHGGDHMGPYRLVRLLDSGSAGEVYIAEHELLKRRCALKLARPGDENAALRFDHGMRAAALLSHPNTVAIFDAGRTDDGVQYCVMEYLPGLCVADIVRRSGPMPAARAVHFARQVCGALAEAHRVGLVHRDLSPANVFVAVLGGRCDVAKLLDFGAAAGPGLASAADPAAVGALAGTPEYVAPEQAVAGAALDGRADVYGLGALLFFMVTGRPPFVRGTPEEVLRAHVSEPVPAPRQLVPGIPADLEGVILRCLAKRPEDRYPDARAVEAALAACGGAAEWDEDRAERWWLEESSAHRADTAAAPMREGASVGASEAAAPPRA